MAPCGRWHSPCWTKHSCTAFFLNGGSMVFNATKCEIDSQGQKSYLLYICLFPQLYFEVTMHTPKAKDITKHFIISICYATVNPCSKKQNAHSMYFCYSHYLKDSPNHCLGFDLLNFSIIVLKL